MVYIVYTHFFSHSESLAKLCKNSFFILEYVFRLLTKFPFNQIYHTHTQNNNIKSKTVQCISLTSAVSELSSFPQSNRRVVCILVTCIPLRIGFCGARFHFNGRNDSRNTKYYSGSMEKIVEKTFDIFDIIYDFLST